MVTHILYGSSTGTAERAAWRVYDSLKAQNGTPPLINDMYEITPADVAAEDFSSTLFVFVTATYGEGELPTAAEEFFEAVKSEDTDFTGMRFAVFGLGDIIYEATYNRGGQIIRDALIARGAEQVGTLGEFNNSGNETIEAAIDAWTASNLVKDDA